MKQKIILILSVVIGLLAFALTQNYLKNERAKLYEGAQRVPIIVAARNLPAGTVLQFQDLALRDVFASSVGQNIFGPDDQNRVIGKRLRFPLNRGEPLWWSHVDLPERGEEGLAPAIRSGLRALSIPISGPASVSGLIAPGDRVDILGTFTFPSRSHEGELESVTLTLLQDVSVLATGQRLARDNAVPGAPSGGSYSMITFEVTPRESELLVFAQHVRGQLHLTLRNTEDVHYERALPSVNFEHIENKLEEYNLYRQQFIRHKSEL